MLQLIPFLAKLMENKGTIGQVGDLLRQGGDTAKGAIDILGKMGELDGLLPPIQGGGYEGVGKTAGAGIQGGIGPTLPPEATGGQIPSSGVVSLLPGGAGVPQNLGGFKGNSAPVSTNLPGAGINGAGAASGLLPPTEPTQSVPTNLTPGEAIGYGGQVRKGLLGKYMNTMQKVNDALESTPLLGHVLRSSSGEIQERQLPMERMKAQQSQQLATYKAMWDQIKHQDMVAARDRATQATRDVGRANVAARDRGTAQRAKAAERADIRGLLGIRDKALDDTTIAAITNELRKRGVDVPEEVKKEGGFFNWIAGLVKAGGEGVQEIRDVVGSMMSGGKKGSVGNKGASAGNKRPPLSAFER